jgi:hypothetical protein
MFTIKLQGEEKQRFAHPAVKALLLEYFFTGHNSDAFYDIDAFGPMIPLPTIALVIAVVSILLICLLYSNISTVESLFG